MKLFYFPGNNFGDNLNSWLWERLLPGAWNGDGRVMLSGIGTIISNRMPKAKSWIVLGSGAGYLPTPKGFGGPGWNVLCVRGPLSAKVFGLPPEKAVTDGAIYLSLLPECAPLPEDRRHGVVFMPHHLALRRGHWQEACARAGIELIDPTGDSHDILERLRSAKLVIADAMHAAIVADTLRVPWIPVATSPQINVFKWLDWTLSMSVPYEPIVLPSSSRQEALESWFWRFRGEKHFLDERTPEAAIEHFRRMRWIKERFWWVPLRKAVSLTYKTAALFLSFDGNPAKDQPYVEKAAEALRKVAEGKAYLSDTDVFEKKKKKMIDCLDRIRA